MRASITMAALVAVTAALTPATVSAAPADLAPLLGGPGTGKHIVVLKTRNVTADDVARQAGARITHRFTAALTGFSATLNKSQLGEVRSNPAVAYVEPDRAIRVAPTGSGTQTSGVQNPTPSWGLDRIDQRNRPLDATYHWLSTGQGVRAYVLSSGINPDSEFGWRLLPGRNVIPGGTSTSDCLGTGTNLARLIGGTTNGVAKEVYLVPIKWTDCGSGGSLTSLIAAIDWVTANAVKPATAIVPAAGGPSTALDNALSGSIASGVTYSVLAGNSNSSACNFSPSRVSEALTVGASDSADYRGAFSNHGPCLDLFAPGVSIALPASGGVNLVSGTEWPTAYVTGVTALYLQLHPTATPQQVHDAVNANATAGVLQGVPTGTPNRLLYSQLT